jgi:hypothetical protein
MNKNLSTRLALLMVGVLCILLGLYCKDFDPRSALTMEESLSNMCMGPLGFVLGTVLVLMALLNRIGPFVKP